MKNMKIFLTILAVVLVLGMTVVGCDNGSDDGGSSLGPQNVPEFAPNSPYKNYTPITKNEVQGVYDQAITELKSELESQVSLLQELGLKVTMSSSSSNRAGRAAGSYNGDITKYLNDNQIPIPKGVDISGKVNATYSFPDNEENPFPISVNGSATLEVTLSEAFEDFEDEDIGVAAKIKGSVNVNNVKITDPDHISGSANFNYNCAVNVAMKDTQKYAKCITDISASVNLSNKTGNVTVKISIYGDGKDALLSDTITFKLEPAK